MKTRLLIIIGVASIIIGIDGFWFVSSDIHENCSFNLRWGHNVYADSFIPCEIASNIIPVSFVLFISGLGILIFYTIKKLRHRRSKRKIGNEN